MLPQELGWFEILSPTMGVIRLEPLDTKNDSGREVPILKSLNGRLFELFLECARGKKPGD